MTEFQETAKLNYNVTSYKHVRRIEDIKQVLMQKNSTFPMITELMYMDYFIPCEMVSEYQETSICTGA